MSKKIIIRYFSLLCFFSVLIGCAPTVPIVQTEVEPEPDTLIVPEEPQPDTVTTQSIIDSLLKVANSLCILEDYPQAHMSLCEAIQIIEFKNGLPEKDTWNDTGNALIRIAELYTTALPNEYLDSIPATLSSIIFRYQISKIIDTLSLSPDDSSIISILECEEGIPYNIPIVHNERVQNALFSIITKRRRALPRLLARAEHYLPYMQQLFTEHDMPTDLTYLPILESGFNPKAYSYAHASGIWQFIPSTGKIFGLRRNYWIDERRDPIKSTNAAIQYLKKLYADFNDWYLALGAYNCGERNIARAIKKAESTDYWDLKLPNQTMHYVPQFIAYQIIGKNPQCFGIQADQTDTFNPDTVHISDCLDLIKISEGLNISYTELKKLNPHLRQWCTPPNMENVALYLPFGFADTFRVFFESLSEDDKVRWFRYRIKSGDNLLSIAGRFKISVPAIKSINKLRSNFIVAGRYLYIPIPVNGSYPTIKQYMVKEKGTKKRKEPQAVRAFRKKGLKPVKYKLSSGETIADVSKLFNIKINAICRWNNITNARRLQPGTVIKLYIEDQNSIPQKTTTQSIKKQPKKQPTDGPKSIYTVKKGDNLYSIANNLGTTVETLASWNNKNLDNPIIKPGEQLVFYQQHTIKKPKSTPVTRSGNTILYKIKKGDNLSLLADLFSTDINKILQVNNLSKNSIIKPGDLIRIPDTGSNKKKLKKKNAQHSPGRIIYYKVQKGDNLWTIADLFSVTVDSLYKANKLNNKSVLMPGDTIRIVLPEGS